MEEGHDTRQVVKELAALDKAHKQLKKDYEKKISKFERDMAIKKIDLK